MAYYAAVSAVRIQSWLARTPELRLVRGASVALTNATARASFSRRLQPSAQVEADPDTADVGGVCVLSSDADSSDDIDAAVENVRRGLQSELPGVEWVAWRTEADSYAAAYDMAQGKSGAAADVGIRRWPAALPLTLDLPVAAACERCAHEIAVKKVPWPEGAVGLGPECVRRYDAGELAKKDDPEFDRFKDFEALAKVGKQGNTIGRRDAANHLATVCADGNCVGDFFSAVARLRTPDLQKKLSSALNEAATKATEQAAKAKRASDGADITIAMTQFVGGDDIFASVAAPFAWEYVETLGRVFEETFRNRVTEALLGAEAEAAAAQVKKSHEEEINAAALVEVVRKRANEVSLGIGVAFAHYKHPIAETREAASGAEERAKASVRGKKGAVSWVDLTVEPAASTVMRGVPRHVTVEQLADDLHKTPALFKMPASARGVLTSLLRPKQGEGPDEIADGVRAWAKRVDQLDLLERYLPEEGSEHAAEMLDTLRDHLDRVRWWPAGARDASKGASE